MNNPLAFSERLKHQLKYLMPVPLRQQLQRRYFHGFCIGTPKSGTTSVAGLFDRHFRAAHEPERRSLIRLLHAHSKKQVTDEEYVYCLQKRDKRIWLDLESTCFLGYRPDLLLRAFPSSQFLLTIREPASWLDSMINHTINYPPESEQVIQIWHQLFFQPQRFPHRRQERLLKYHGAYSVEAYLRFWNRANQRIIDNIPPSQLLIIPTQAISSQPETIARFFGVQTNRLDHGASHLNPAPQKYHLSNEIPKEFLQQACQQHCSAHLLKLARPSNLSSSGVSESGV